MIYINNKLFNNKITTCLARRTTIKKNIYTNTNTMTRKKTVNTKSVVINMMLKAMNTKMRTCPASKKTIMIKDKE